MSYRRKIDCYFEIYLPIVYQNNNQYKMPSFYNTMPNYELVGRDCTVSTFGEYIVVNTLEYGFTYIVSYNEITREYKIVSSTNRNLIPKQ
jgi:hypothetical protein